jgi:predicted DNA-binding protein (UPF0251 family)
MTKSKTEEELRRAWEKRSRGKKEDALRRDQEFLTTMRKIMGSDEIDKTQAAADIGVSRQTIHNVINRVKGRAERGET